jgi:hypothetical protein
MEVVSAICSRTVGTISIVSPYTINCGINWTATASSHSTDVIVYKLFTVAVLVENPIEEKVSNGIAFKCIVVSNAGV